MLRWSGQNANQKVDPDKMPTTENKSGTKCQPRLAFCPVGILSTHLRTQIHDIIQGLVYDILLIDILHDTYNHHIDRLQGAWGASGEIDRKTFRGKRGERLEIAQKWWFNYLVIFPNGWNLTIGQKWFVSDYSMIWCFSQKAENWQRHNNDQEDVTECQYQVRMRRIQTYYWSCHMFFGI